jgi:transcriptional regulator with XRE-family HTH domain
MDVTIDFVNQTNQLLVKNIEKELEQRGWKIPQLAKATGLSASGLYGVLDGSRWPGPDNLERIARALKTSPGALLGQSQGVGENEKEYAARLRLLSLINRLDKSEVPRFVGLLEELLGPESERTHMLPDKPKKA